VRSNVIRKSARCGPKLLGVLTDDSLWSRLCLRLWLCLQTLRFIELFWSTRKPAYIWWFASRRFSSGTMARKSSPAGRSRTFLPGFFSAAKGSRQERGLRDRRSAGERTAGRIFQGSLRQGRQNRKRRSGGGRELWCEQRQYGPTEKAVGKSDEADTRL